MKKLLLLMVLVANVCLADPPTNLLRNGSFDQDALGWAQVPDTVALWDTPDAFYSPFSGSILLVDDKLNGTPDFRPILQQCIQLTHPGGYVIRYSGYVTSMDGDNWLGVKYLIRNGQTCEEPYDDGNVRYVTDRDTWHRSQFELAASSSSAALLFQIGTLRRASGVEFSGHLDEILLSDDAMFLGSFE